MRHQSSKLEEIEHMKARGFGSIVAFGAFILLVGLACGSVSSTVVASTAAAAPTVAPQQPTSSSGSSGSSGSSSPVTFTDQNKYFAVDVPGDWTHTQDVDQKNNYWYWDVLTSPDGNAKVESVVYNDGTPWTGSQNGAMALNLLNRFYSSTGKEGDIKISSDTIQKDNSERLDWTSKGGGYSGESFFEVRNRLAFLMFTIRWTNASADQYQKTLDDVVSSYRIP
jgi:hypothetical protein